MKLTICLISLLLIFGCTSPGAQANQSSQNSSNLSDYAGPMEVTYESSPYQLEGYLWVPNGKGPFPAIIYNHGSEQDPGPKPSIGRFFASHGYVVFMPIRRGHIPSSGPYIGDIINQTAPEGRRQAQVDQLVVQVDDVAAGIDYVRKLGNVDPSRMAVAGCSYGGIETMLTSERLIGLKAAVDFAGDSESWGNTLLEERLNEAVDKSKVPIFFLQAENDYHTEPTYSFSAEMSRNNSFNQSALMKIFPPFGTTPQEGHAGFCMSPSVWGDDVLSFLKGNGVG